MKNLRNRVQLIGNLGADPEVKNLESGKLMAKLSIATSDSYINNTGDKIEDTQWHNVVAWDKLSDFSNQYLKKGQLVYIEGKIRTRSWEDSNGNKKYKTEIVSQQITPLEWKKTDNN